MVRPFRFGDIFLIQRLGRQATKLNIVQATLHRQSAVGASLSSVLPWKHGKVTTYILRQRGHRLARDGFLQVQKRPGRPELDIVFLAPGLDARRGHPAIWEKLLSHHTYEAANRRIERIYADVPDQPLPVSTFTHAGYRAYDHETIWRLTPQALDDYSHLLSADFRPQASADEWALEALYRRVVPKEVQAAEGMQDGSNVTPPILGWWQGGSYANYVLVDREDVAASVQIVRGDRGVWLQVWCDYLDPDPTQMHQLLRFALTLINRRASGRTAHVPVYVAVRQHHGALGAALGDYGFAPVTDRAKMVKHVYQWVRDAAHVRPTAMESAPTAVTVHFDMGREPVNWVRSVQPVTGHPSAPRYGAEPAEASVASDRRDGQTRSRLALEQPFG